MRIHREIDKPRLSLAVEFEQHFLGETPVSSECCVDRVRAIVEQALNLLCGEFRIMRCAGTGEVISVTRQRIAHVVRNVFVSRDEKADIWTG